MPTTYSPSEQTQAAVLQAISYFSDRAPAANFTAPVLKTDPALQLK